MNTTNYNRGDIVDIAIDLEDILKENPSPLKYTAEFIAAVSGKEAKVSFTQIEGEALVCVQPIEYLKDVWIPVEALTLKEKAKTEAPEHTIAVKYLTELKEARDLLTRTYVEKGLDAGKNSTKENAEEYSTAVSEAYALEQVIELLKKENK